MSDHTSTDLWLLTDSGYLLAPDLPGTKDSVDREVTQAIERFQRDHSDQLGRPLPVTGDMDDETRSAMIRSVFGRIESAQIGSRIAQIALREAAKCVREDYSVPKKRGAKSKPLNTGPDVEKYQAATAYARYERTGWPWCSAFVSWVYEQVGIPLREAYVPNLVRSAKSTFEWVSYATGLIPPKGVIFVRHDQGHAGIVVYADKDDLYTVEGNTSFDNRGSQAEGDGVYQRVRRPSQMAGFVVKKDLLLRWT